MDIHAQLESLEARLRERLQQVTSLRDLETPRIEFLGRKGLLAQAMAHLSELPPSERPLFGQAANKVKASLNAIMDEHKARLEKAEEQAFLDTFDPSLPGRMPWAGSLHPITLAMEEVCSVFQGMGYEIVCGPEVDTDFHCFEALNMPPEHPARDMQDTLYIQDKVVLRTHTSTMQIRTMLSRRPPIAIIAPGKVYRRDSDNTHTPMFHQIEGLLVDKHVTLADLRGTLTAFLKAVFGEKTRVRFRPSFFPFTEPSVEVDMSCTQCGGHGHLHDGSPCRVCKGSGWLEILGSGVVDPAVFEAVGYDPNEVSGFAFGLGVERIAMLKYGLSDIRMNFENDVRYLSQFAGEKGVL
ncbi:MAG: phenylalanine--tRNA ligase subunit alpha [Mailhella sp.]|nr:phenylalanine--tRNA ligase subunit alpha [Mailhella sp.]